jgi:uncharacterized membrane protein YjgN (DUF898 family)
MEPSGQAPAEARLERIEFTGSGGEYFRIWIVNLLLSILTLGIYSAWAKVRREQYFHGNTQVAGHAFGYHATPGQILRGRLVAALIFLVYILASELSPVGAAIFGIAFLIGLPFLVTRAKRFQMRVTSWRGVRFDFELDYGGAVASFIAAPVLSALSLGLALPWATRLRYRWLVDNASYGNTRFKTTAGLRPFVMAVLGAAGLLALLVVFLFITSGVSSMLVAQMMGPEAGFQPLVLLFAVVYVPLLLGGYLILAFWRRSVLNAVLPATTVGPVTLDCRLSARRLALIYVTNFLGILFTLGLYTPWARVRAAKYQLESCSARFEGSLDQFVATQVRDTSAVGEEIGEMFDVGAEI